jgi:signal transduction histidine kinase
MSSRLDALARLRRSIGCRLALWHTGLFLAGSLAVLALAYFLLASSLRRKDRDAVLSELVELSGDYAARGLPGLKSELPARAPSPRAPDFTVRLLAPDGSVRMLSAPSGGPAFELPAPDVTAKDGTAGWSFARAKGDESVMEVASSRLPDGAVLQVGKNSGERDDLLERFRWIVAAILLPAAALGAAGGVFLTGRALRPLRGLLTAIREIETGKLETRVSVNGSRDELDELGVVFNRMLDRIAALVAGMKNALDDVAHDLRTPMTRLRGGAELALREEAGLEATREALADAVEESDRILSLLDGLMDLSEAETGAIKLSLTEIDLANLLEESAELYGDAALAKGISVRNSAPAGLILLGDLSRLRRVVANLLDNAVKYTPTGGNIALSAGRRDGETVVAVADDGAGIPPQDLPRIWDRLYRGDISRSEKGLGLGLSLVRAVTRAHGGEAEVASAPGKGTTFTLRFPRAPRRT